MKKLIVPLAATAMVAALAVGVFSAYANVSGTTVSMHVATSVSPTPRPSPAPKVNLACMQTAVDKREGAIIVAFDMYHSSISAALTARQAALKTAWGMTDRKARRAAINTAWKNYRAAQRQARKAFIKARSGAWATFNSDRKKCGPGGALDDGTNSAVDISI
jgi:hypothetical protein